MSLRAQEAELILVNGHIITVDDQFHIASALAVRGGKIQAVGDDAAVLALRGVATQVIDLAGKTVLPGLIDSHVHAIDASLTEFDHPIGDMNSIADVLEHVRARAKVVPPGEWILLEQIFITRLQEQRYPTRAELDDAAPAHPVAFLTGPDASVNSMALQRSGIVDDRSAPADTTTGDGGRVERDPATGAATGILRSARKMLKIDTQPRLPSLADRDTRLQELLHDYNALGITSVIDRAVDDDEIAQYARLLDAGKLTVRVRMSYHLDTNAKTAALVEQIDRIAKLPLRREHDQLRLLGIKTFLDGGMLTGSAYLQEPWGVSRIYGIDDPTYRGMRYIPEDTLVAIVRATVDRDLQFTAHSVGDGAVHALLDAYQQVAQEQVPNRIAKTHCCLTHANFLSREAIEQAARLHVCVDMQPAWLFLDGRTLLAQFGTERLRYFQPLRSLFDAGVVAGGGSDHMQKIGAMRAINPYHPFWAMSVACQRRPRWTNDGAALHPEEAITRRQAIEFYTRNNAYLMRMEDRIGSLEVGKLADLIVVDRDVLTCNDEDLSTTRVLQTYLSGVNVILRNSTGP